MSDAVEGVVRPVIEGEPEFKWPPHMLALGWSGKFVPQIGQRVRVTINRLGPARVVGFFAEHAYLGVQVRLEDPPAWWLAQRGAERLCHAFGAELEPLEEEVPAVHWVIRCTVPNAGGGADYWSEEKGWVREGASRYTSDDVSGMILPQSGVLELVEGA